MNKQKEFNKLIKDMGKCELCSQLFKKSNKKLIDCSLINIYKDESICLNIPTVWTDWYSRINADIMIVGQDWGPYQDMLKYRDEYIELLKTDEDAWINLVRRQESLAHKNMYKFLKASAKLENYELEENFMDNIYVTNAVMCARQGTSYRDTKYFDVKPCTLNCTKFLKKQIDIVKPKIILALGYHPLLSLSKIYNFEIGNNLTDVINSIDVIKTDNVVIIPAYHPVAQVKQEEQLKIYSLIWKEVKNEKV